MDLDAQHIWVGSGALGPRAGAIDWFAWPSMKRVDSRAAGATDRGIRYTEEGMAVKGADLFLMPEDGPSRMLRFKLTRRQRLLADVGNSMRTAAA